MCLGNSSIKPNESRRSSLVSICGEDLNHEDDAQDPNVFTLDLNEISGEKLDNGHSSKIRINTSALRDLQGTLNH